MHNVNWRVKVVANRWQLFRKLCWDLICVCDSGTALTLFAIDTTRVVVFENSLLKCSPSNELVFVVAGSFTLSP